MGKPVVVKTKLLKNMVLREFYELVAATEVIPCNHQSCVQIFLANFWKLMDAIFLSGQQ